MRNCVLIIEHDPSVSRFMQLKLEEEGFSCLIDNTGEAAVDLAGQRQVDLILLDPDEPLKGGHEILGKVREISSLPIIYLSSDTSVDAKVEALNAGADDYMTKPFSAAELVARINALTRRKGEVIVHELKYEDLSLQLDTCELYCASQHIHLGYKEFEIMKQLMSHPEMITSKDDLIISVWGSESDAMDNNVEVYISFLRKKLKFLKSQVSIKVIRKVGYRLEVCDA